MSLAVIGAVRGFIVTSAASKGRRFGGGEAIERWGLARLLVRRAKLFFE
ncbi:MAG: hypothetical protein AB4050_20750 [Synechococcus sp.]